MRPTQHEPMLLGADGELSPELAQPVPAESLEALARRAFLLKAQYRTYVIAYFGNKQKKQAAGYWYWDPGMNLGRTFGRVLLLTLTFGTLFSIYASIRHVGQLLEGGMISALFVGSFVISLMMVISEKDKTWPLHLPRLRYIRLERKRLIIGYVLPSHNRHEFDYRFTGPDGQEMIGHCIASKPREPGRRKAAPDRAADSPEAGSPVVVEYIAPLLYRLL